MIELNLLEMDMILDDVKHWREVSAAVRRIVLPTPEDHYGEEEGEWVGLYARMKKLRNSLYTITPEAKENLQPLPARDSVMILAVLEEHLNGVIHQFETFDEIRSQLLPWLTKNPKINGRPAAYTLKDLCTVWHPTKKRHTSTDEIAIDEFLTETVMVKELWHEFGTVKYDDLSEFRVSFHLRNQEALPEIPEWALGGRKESYRAEYVRRKGLTLAFQNEVHRFANIKVLTLEVGPHG